MSISNLLKYKRIFWMTNIPKMIEYHLIFCKRDALLI